MKYIFLGFWYTLLFLLFVVIVIIQFLWDFKKPSVKLSRVIEDGMSGLDSDYIIREYDGSY